MSTLTGKEGEILHSQLRQKLLFLEDSVARLAHTRKQLKDNADLVKNEIGECFGHQLSLLRSREQQLLNTLDTVIMVKDEILSEQQDTLHQTLGACQQSMECLSVAMEEKRKRHLSESLETVTVNVRDTLHKLSTIEMKPRETAQVAFEADHVTLRRFLQTFGRINTAANNHKHSKTSESLPGDLEDYEEVPRLMQKPVQQFNKPTGLNMGFPRLNLEESSLGQSLLREALTTRGFYHGVLDPSSARFEEKVSVRNQHQIGQWLNQMKTNDHEPSVLMEDFEIVRQNTTKGKDESVLNNKEPDMEFLFSGYFNKILSAPASDWTLMSDVGYPDSQNLGSEPDFLDMANLDITDNSEPANAKSMIPNKFNEVSETSDHQIYADPDKEEEEEGMKEAAVTMIFPNFNDKIWLHQPGSTNKTTYEGRDREDILVLTSPPTHMSMMDEDDAPPLTKLIKMDTTTQHAHECGGEKLSQLKDGLKEWLYQGDPMPGDTANSRQQLEVFESVLGWKSVLEKVHGRGDEHWLIQPPP